MFKVGQIVDNRYEIKEKIAQGGMGIVYLAIDKQFNDEVALKVSICFEPGQRAFQHEAALLNKLKHDGLPKVRGYVIEDNLQCFVMEYIRGENLKQIIEKVKANGQRGLSEPQIIDIAYQLCRIVNYLHTQPIPIIHRDIKPANIKLMPNGKIILLDFGLSKSEVTQMAGGTPAYSSIEQLLQLKTDVRSDIYSIGATLYFLATGEQPIPSKFRSYTEEDPLIPISKLNPQISKPLCNLIEHAMQYEASLRPQSVPEIVRALNKLDFDKDRMKSKEGFVIAAERNDEDTQENLVSYTVPNEHTVSNLFNQMIQEKVEKSGNSQSQEVRDSQSQEILPNENSVSRPVVNNSRRNGWTIGLVTAVAFLCALAGIAFWGTIFTWKKEAVQTTPTPPEIKMPPIENTNTETKPPPPIEKPVEVKRNSFTLKTFLRNNTEVKADYQFTKDDAISFNLTPNQDGFVYIIGEELNNNTLDLWYPSKQFGKKGEIIKATKTLSFPPKSNYLQVNIKDFKIGRVYFVVATDNNAELVQQITTVFAEGKKLPQTEAKVAELLATLHKLSNENKSAENMFESGSEITVGWVKIADK